MKPHFPPIRILLLALLFVCAVKGTNGQLYAPTRNWAATTHYLGNIPQDSIFVFFAGPTQSNVGRLRAQFSDGSQSSFQWYRYNPSPSIPPQNRFQLFLAHDALLFSEVQNLSPGGYRVVITRESDSQQETYTAWVFEDKVVISRIYTDNQCDFLFLEAITLPDRNTIRYETFSYFDLSLPTHTINNTLGTSYFSNFTWSSDNSNVPVPSSSAISISISNPAPLYDASYHVEATNIFGRRFEAQTPTIVAKAIKDEVYIEVKDESSDEWVAFDKSKQYEALLELRIGITIPANVKIDSLYFYVNRLNDSNGPLRMERVWADSSRHTPAASSTSFFLYPEKRLFVPGDYKLVHRAKSRTTGCAFHAYVPNDENALIKVAKSELKIDGIPNVFTPNGDGQNDFFLIKEPDTNLKSIALFTIHIHNRWGKRVYSFTGDPRKWEGWNGRVEGTRADAPEGVYYFVIEAIGWDGKKFQGGPYKGFMYLFRGN